MVRLQNIADNSLTVYLWNYLVLSICSVFALAFKRADTLTERRIEREMNE